MPFYDRSKNRRLRWLVESSVGVYSVPMNNDEPLALWERELLYGRSPEGYGDVTFYRLDGRTVFFRDVEVDGIGSDYGTAGLGVVTATQHDGTVIHIPFVEYWTVEYR